MDPPACYEPAQVGSPAVRNDIPKVRTGRPHKAGSPPRKPRPAGSAVRRAAKPAPRAPQPPAPVEDLPGFIERQVGRPWDKVLGELRATLGAGAKRREEALAELDRILVRKVRPVPATRAFPSGLLRADAGARRTPVEPGQLYVDPRDGIIKLARRRFFDRQTPAEITYSRINADEIAVKRDGGWAAVTVRPAVFPPEGVLNDALLGPVPAQDSRRLRDLYGSAVYGLAQRPLSARELRNLGLSNEPS